MKRIGYIGLSTPSFYDYKNSAPRAHGDMRSSPNPIVEGAFGSMLLYDELWFLSRSLCPANMRSLHYVRFLDEMNKVPAVDMDWLGKADEMFDPTALSAFDESSAAYGEVKENAKVYWDAAADNHTHGIQIAGQRLNGNSWDVRNVMFDAVVVARLGNVELITNSFTSRLFKKEASVRNKLVLSEILVLNSVPQFLSPEGPYLCLYRRSA